MLQRIETLPSGVWGLRAIGKVSKDDYDRIVVPELDAARREGRRLRFLYHFGPEFDGLTPGAAWEDTRVGLHYLRLFERCAVVTDIEWLQTATRVVAPMMPCPVKVFGNSQWDDAVSWLGASPTHSVGYRVLPDRGVLVIEPHGPLRPEDFDALSAQVDEWIESSDAPLRGIVIHARTFPGWENLGAVLRHVRFIRDHHRQVPRIAVSTDAALAGVAAGLADHFVKATIKRYDYDDVECAVDWASGREETEQSAESRSMHPMH